MDLNAVSVGVPEIIPPLCESAGAVYLNPSGKVSATVVNPGPDNVYVNGLFPPKAAGRAIAVESRVFCVVM